MPVSLNYIVKRLFWSILVLVGVVVFSYLVIIFSPGDPATKWAGNPRGVNATLAIEAARRELGLDKPLHIQVFDFIIKVFTGNLGTSIAYKQPVFTILYSNLAATLELLFCSYVIILPIGIFLGVYSALHRDELIDDLLQTFGTVMANTPAFWLAAIVFLLLVSSGHPVYGRIDTRLALETGFQPITGFYLLDSLLQGNIIIFIDVLIKLIPPALIVGVYPLGLSIRLSRTLMAESLTEDFVRAAVAWGVRKRRIIWRYAFRASIPPLVQVSGLAFAYSLIDAMVVEYAVFGREGLGRLLVDALNYSDFKLAIGLLIVVTVFYLVINTLADVIQALIDPRVRL
ncbi:ABC transporter permease [Thermosphaera chiliense]|uniref:ABC transporter permease n=1 Tax=Thermosphaera chiliense TaxID=3402707 RepID=A0A7M1UQD3_9CREN|nr:ABC transporter permease [Thermosphaera aggregans]QOR94199.1 ABC transporter permease [Thermosphaera aggregans]